MKRIMTACAAAAVLSATVAYAAWMTNINHHAQVRIPDGWNTEYQVMAREDGRQAHMILASDHRAEKVAAIASMETDTEIDLKAFKDFFEKEILTSAVEVESEERGFNNLKGIYVIYDAEFNDKNFRMMCFFTRHSPYFYAVFTGTEKENFEENKHFLDELLVTFQYVK